MNEKIIDKIQKLFRLATSSNEHEAANAAARAAQLMHDYQISEALLSVESGKAPTREDIVESTISGEGRSNKEQWKSVIVRGIGEAMDVHCYSHKAEFRLFGRISQVQTAKYMFDYLVNEVNRLADEAYSPYFGHAKSWKNGFRRGCASTIQKRLFEMAREKKNIGDSRALVIVKQDRLEVDDAWERRTQNLQLRKGTAPAVRDGNAFQQGMEAGNSVNLERNARGLGGRSKELK